MPLARCLVVVHLTTRAIAPDDAVRLTLDVHLKNAADGAR